MAPAHHRTGPAEAVPVAVVSQLGERSRCRALGREELLFILDRHWKRLGAHSTPRTSPTPRKSPQLNASPAAISGSSRDSSLKLVFA